MEPVIPPGKVKTVVIFELFVMKRMMRGADQGPHKRYPGKPGRVDFNVKVIDHTAEGHNKKHQHQYPYIHGQKKQDQGKKDRLDQPF